jgi:hypothetical protein
MLMSLPDTRIAEGLKKCVSFLDLGFKGVRDKDLKIVCFHYQPNTTQICVSFDLISQNRISKENLVKTCCLKGPLSIN